MAEIQKTSMGQSEMQSRFIEFVLMQTQNILFLLGKIPTPDGKPGKVNLEFARVLVDQLEMIENKTQGNLSTEEMEVLKNALANVRLAFVETAKGIPGSASPSAFTPTATSSETEISPPSPSQSSEKDNDEDEENKKRFTKKYS